MLVGDVVVIAVTLDRWMADLGILSGQAEALHTISNPW